MEINTDGRMVGRKDSGTNRNRAGQSRSGETRNEHADALPNHEEKGDVLSHECFKDL